MNLLHECIAEGHDTASFVADPSTPLVCRGRRTWEIALVTLFEMMQQLDRQGKNRVWRSSSASVCRPFFQGYSIVVGNPPHVNWESLTPEWRKGSGIDLQRLGLFTLSGLESRHGVARRT